MSAPSGIKVPTSLSSAFSSALADADDVRALVFVIEGESFSHLTTVKPKSSFKDDIALLPPALPNHKTPASFAYRLDSKEGGKHEWMMITFVPDDAGVRAKMLQASSRAGLLKALGANNFKHDWFATSIKDLTPSSLSSHLNHLSSPAPLSASEKALKEVLEAEAAEAKRTALDPEAEARRRKAVSGLSGKMRWGEGVEGAMQKVAERSNDGWIVVLEIPQSDVGSVALVTSSACTPSQLFSKLPSKSPAYVFYSFPTPPPPPSSPPATKNWKATAAPGNTFQASEGGRRTVATQWAPSGEDGKSSDLTKEPAAQAEGEEKAETAGDAEEQPKAEPEESLTKLDIKADAAEDEETKPVVESPKEDKQASFPSPAPAKDVKGRVIFVYSCPSGSPVKYRMVYSTNVRSVQADASSKAGVEVVSKLETSDIADLTESHLRSSLPSGKPTHSSSLPTPSSTSGHTSSPGFGAPKPAFGAPAPAFGGAFGRPRPVVKKDSSMSSISASDVPLPSTGPTTPIASTPSASGDTAGDGEDSKESIRKAFDAFGPRVGGGGGGGGFARPRPAGKR